MFEELFKSTELHDAVSEGDTEHVCHLLEAGADVNARAWHDITPLMLACQPELSKVLSLTHGITKAVTDEVDKAFSADGPPLFDPKTFRLNVKQAFEMKKTADKNRKYNDTPPPDNPSIVRLLLEHGADVNAVDKEQHSALMKAASAGRAQTAHVLLEYGADLRAEDKEGLTPLMLAAQSRRLEIVHMLLEKGADVDHRTPQGNTVLMAAAEGGRVEIVHLLMARNQDVNTVGVNGQTALLRAGLSGHEEMIAFLKQAGARIGFLEAVILDDIAVAQSLPSPDPTERGPQWGFAPLFWAVKHERPDALRLLLERGVSANAANKSGQTILFSAVMRGEAECARILLDAGADPNPNMPHGMSPLNWAGNRGDTAIMNLLLERGADPNAGSKREMGGGLMGAIMFGNVEAARRLLEAGADPNAKSDVGFTPLAFATARDDKEMVKLLLEWGASVKGDENTIPASLMAHHKPEIAALLKQAAGVNPHELAKEGKTAELLAHLDAGADINAPGEHGETLLIAALRGKQGDTARILIERGADVNAPDRIGQTALICAAMRGDLDTTRLLLKRGADIAVADNRGQTALLSAAFADKQDIITLLADAGAQIGPVEAAILGDLLAVRRMLDAGADVDTRTRGGITPLMGAAARGHLDVLTALLIRRVDINAVDEEGQTALTWAVMHEQKEALHLLLDEGADVNLAGENRQFNRQMETSMKRKNLSMDKLFLRRGTTPLGAAALHNATDIAELLLDRGAEVNQSCGFNGQAIGMAAMLGHADMVRLLLGRGADPTLKDATGQTALGWAQQSNKSAEVIELLTNAGG